MNIPTTTRTMIVGLIFCGSVTILTYIFLLLNPSCCDAVSYGKIAAEYQIGGLLTNHELSGVRTYAYPLFLAILQSPEALAGERYGLKDIWIPIIQYLLFAASTVALVKAIDDRLGCRASFAVALGVFGNIFILVYIPHRLGETLSFSCLMLIIASITIKNHSALIIGALLAGLSLMIRPANLPIALGFFSVLILYLRKSKDYRTVILCIVAFLLPLLPQFLINWTIHNVMSPLPAIKLGDLQIQWGIQYAKYATNLSGGQPQMYYPNPFIDNNNSDLVFYFSGIGTALLHVFNSLTSDYLIPYIYELRPWYATLMIALNHAVVFFGTTAAFRILRVRSQKGQITFHDGWWIFTLVFVVATCALNAIVAVESRFGLAVFAVLCPLAAYALLFLRRPSKYTVIFGIVYIVFAVWLAIWQREIAIANLLL